MTMRYYIKSALFAALFLLSSCSSIEQFGDEPMTSEPGVYGCIETVVEDDPDTKAQITYSSGIQVAFEIGDQINIWSDSGTLLVYSVEEVLGNGRALFSGGGYTLTEGSTYLSSFPLITNIKERYNALSITYDGQIQSEDGNPGHIADYVYSYAAATCNNGRTSFNYHNLSSFFRFEITLPAAITVTELSITAANEAFPLNGTIDMTNEGAFTPGDRSTDTMLLELDNVSVSNDNVLDAYMAVAPRGADNYTICVKDSNGNVYTSPVISKTALEANHSKAFVTEVSAPDVPDSVVDLGLSVLWATCNLSENGFVSSPEEYGDYFAWGETEPHYLEGHGQDNPCNTWRTGRGHYYWDHYQWSNGSNNSLTKYCPSNKTSYWGGSGSPDNMTELSDYDYVDDAARTILGGDWRMPTYTEWKELLENCTLTWTDNYDGTGVAGRIVTSNVPGYTDKSIFLPAAGFWSLASIRNPGSFGAYWSSSLCMGDVGYVNPVSPEYGWSADFTSGYVGNYGDGRCTGHSIRPVTEASAVPAESIPVTSVTLNKTDLVLTVDASERLTATVTPGDATDKSLTWSSSDTGVAVVDNLGRVIAKAPGNATVTATAKDGSGVSGSCSVTVSPPPPGPVDLGLSVKWASCNLSENGLVSSPEMFGDYYAWGETEPHYLEGHSQDSPCYSWRTGRGPYYWNAYQWCNGSSNSLTRYCPSNKSSYWGGSGSPDNKTEFRDYDYADDAARATLGGNWRMPTDTEWTELRTNCTWTWTNDYNGTGVAGRIVTSNKPGYSDKSIFLPAAGYRKDNNLTYTGERGKYWSSSLYPNDPYYSCSVSFESGNVYRDYLASRSYGYSIRPVQE